MKPVTVMVVFAILCSPAAVAQGQQPATTPAASSGQPAAPSVPPGPAADKQSAEALAQKYVELWNTGNFDLIDSIFQFPAFMTSRGRRARLDRSMLKRVITAWRTSMPDLNFKIDDTIVQGNRVAMRLAFTGSYKQRLFPNTADPKDHPTGLRATAMWMLEVRDGKIRQMWEEYDEIGMHYLMGGRWRSNEELEAAAKADAAKSQPASESETVPQSAPTPESAPSPTPPPKL